VKLGDDEDLSELFALVQSPAQRPRVPVPPVEFVPLSAPDPAAYVTEAWTDGGCRGNPGPAGWGVYIRHGGQTICLKGTLARATNNEAEYAGLLACLRWARDTRVRAIQIYMDSELVVRQMQGRYSVGGKLRPLYLNACALAMDLGNGAVVLNHVRRERNTHADRLANEAMDEAGFAHERRWPRPPRVSSASSE
jgi:ribonuclease HI